MHLLKSLLLVRLSLPLVSLLHLVQFAPQLSILCFQVSDAPPIAYNQLTDQRLHLCTDGSRKSLVDHVPHHLFANDESWRTQARK